MQKRKGDDPADLLDRSVVLEFGQASVKVGRRVWVPKDGGDSAERVLPGLFVRDRVR